MIKTTLTFKRGNTVLIIVLLCSILPVLASGLEFTSINPGFAHLGETVPVHLYGSGFLANTNDIIYIETSVEEWPESIETVSDTELIATFNFTDLALDHTVDTGTFDVSLYDHNTEQFIALPGAFTILAEEPTLTPTPTPTSTPIPPVPLHLTSIHPDTAPNTGRSTVQVFGSGFDSNQPHLQLNLGGGITWDSISNYSYQSDEEFYADIDLTGAPEGVYPVEIYNPANRDINDSLWNAFTVANITESTITPTPTRRPGVGLYADVTESGVIYHWNIDSKVNVYIDGIEVAQNTTKSQWIISNVKSNEEHQIRLLFSDNQSFAGSLIVTTLHPEWFVMFMILTLFILFIIQIFTRENTIVSIIISGISVSLGIFTGVMATGYGGLMIIPYLFVVLAGGFILYALWTIIIEKTQWG